MKTATYFEKMVKVCCNNEEIYVKIHSRDALNLLNLLDDVGFIYQKEVELPPPIYDTHDYSNSDN